MKKYYRERIEESGNEKENEVNIELLKQKIQRAEPKRNFKFEINRYEGFIFVSTDYDRI